MTNRGIKTAIVAVLSLLATCLVMLTGSQAASAVTSVYYVSPYGTGTPDGLSWNTAWHTFTDINWSTMPSDGSPVVVLVDGGSSAPCASPWKPGDTEDPGVTCGVRYDAPLTFQRSNVTVMGAASTGHNGSVVIDGNRRRPDGQNVVLPSCNKTAWSGNNNNQALGVDFGTTTGSSVVGQSPGQFIIRGAQNGVYMTATGGDTLRDVEIADNGLSKVLANGNLNSDGNGVLIGGPNNLVTDSLIHDNGQDQFHSRGVPPGAAASGTSVRRSWMGALRSNPSFAWEPFNDLQIANPGVDCTHADSFQLFYPSGTFSGLDFEYDMFGPGVNQGLYPNDTPGSVLYNNVTVRKSLFIAESHGISIDHTISGSPTGWDIENNVFFNPQFALGGSLDIPNGGTFVVSNNIKWYGGMGKTPGAYTGGTGNVSWPTGTASNDLPPTSIEKNPMFVNRPAAANASLTTLQGSDFLPQYTGYVPNDQITSFGAADGNSLAGAIAADNVANPPCSAYCAL